MRQICILYILIATIAGTPSVVSCNPFETSPQLPDSLVGELSGCWNKTLFRSGLVHDLTVQISTTLGNRAVELNIILSKYNDNMFFVKLIAAPGTTGGHWNCLWMDSGNNLQPGLIEIKGATIYAMAELPEVTEHLYLFRQSDGSLRLVVKTERDGIGTFPIREHLIPCSPAEKDIESPSP